MRSRLVFIQAILLLALPGMLNGQLRFMAAGTAGAGFSLNDIGPGTGGGFGYQGALGVLLRGVTIGGEVGAHSLGYDRKARIFGGFVRLSGFASGPIQPYFVLGVGAYRYTPASGGSATAIGGSVGPGARFQLGSPRLSLLLEARLHTDLEGTRQVSTQEFLAVLGGFQVGL